MGDTVKVGKVCERCKYEINISYILRQNSMGKIICPNCGRTLVATVMSKFLMTSIFLMFFLLFIIMPLDIINRLIIEAIWITISYSILPAFIYDYEEINKDETG
jgi:CXXC-20-CXXC protein